MNTIRLTTGQALARFLVNQYVRLDDGDELPLFAGVWAIFGHGNVAGIGEALFQVKDQLPTYRGHNEQSMAHAAIAFSKARRRQQLMVATSSIGPGATNMVTAAAVAHVNRIPVLFIPGDVFASGLPDPVLQQAEDFCDGSATVNDAFRPVSRYFQVLYPEFVRSNHRWNQVQQSRPWNHQATRFHHRLLFRCYHLSDFVMLQRLLLHLLFHPDLETQESLSGLKDSHV